MPRFNCKRAVRDALLDGPAGDVQLLLEARVRAEGDGEAEGRLHGKGTPLLLRARRR